MNDSDSGVIPSNIRQIGTIEDGLRIYVEDYVCTYLSQYAESGGFDERVALLVGRCLTIDGQTVLFISGAIQGKFAEEKNGQLTFTEKTGAYADVVIAEFFHGREIVGWMQSQPSYGTFLSPPSAEYHRREFSKLHQVLFVMDPLERLNAFYLSKPGQDGLTEAKGYFIYYDKNRNMHEYMLKEKAAGQKTPSMSYMEVSRIVEEEKAAAKAAENPENPENILRRRQSERTRRQTRSDQHRTMNLLVSLSAVLFIICFVMGAGLIQNQDRLSSMETQLLQLSTAYRNLFVQMSGDNTAAVFAAQTEADGNPAAVSPPAAPQENTKVNAPMAYPAENPSLLTPEVVTPAHVIEENGNLIQTPSPAPEPAPAFNAADEAAQVSIVPPSPTAVPVHSTYTIQEGDSLIAISVRFYGDSSRINDILVLNGLEDADKIVAGKTLALP